MAVQYEIGDERGHVVVVILVNPCEVCPSMRSFSHLGSSDNYSWCDIHRGQYCAVVYVARRVVCVVWYWAAWCRVAAGGPGLVPAVSEVLYLQYLVTG